MQIQRILVPLDFSEHSEKALQWAVARHAPCPVLLVGRTAPA